MKKFITILVLGILFTSINLFSQGTASVTSNFTQKKIALVIGNGNYLHSVPCSQPGQETGWLAG